MPQPEREMLLSQKSVTIEAPADLRIQFPEARSFTFRRRKVRDTTRIAIVQDDLCEGQKLKMNNEALNYSYAVAALNVLLEAPSAFDFSEVEDDMSVLDIFLKYERWRNGFSEPLPQSPAAAGGAADRRDDRPALPTAVQPAGD